MSSIIVGTAGHIDHGKSALVRALTGTDPDRLPEEKRRGITIDLGFADLELDDLRIGFVDVPGHERFIRNMLAGAHGIDLLALVIAADESVMPQTREHFEICRLLGVSNGLVVITKKDLVDEDMLALVEDEVRELVEGSFLDNAPVVAVSSRTGAGLDDLKSRLTEMGKRVPPRSHDFTMRLPIDRAFSMKGFGTVVTGTLISGKITEGEELELLPAKTSVRVRGLQVHNKSVREAHAGQRTAVNLAGVDTAQIERGMVLAPVGRLRPTQIVDVVIDALPGASRPVRSRSRVRFHAGAAEVLGRVRVLEGVQQIAPGSSGLAQLRLEAPVVAVHGDRFILRSYSPAETIAGGVIVDPFATKHRGREMEHTLDLLRSLMHDERGTKFETFVQAAGDTGLRLERLAAATGWTNDVLAGVASEVLKHGTVVEVGGLFIARASFDKLSGAVVAELERYHKREPLARGMLRETLREKLFAHSASELFSGVITGLEEQGKVVSEKDIVRSSRHTVGLSEQETELSKRIEQLYLAAGVEAPTIDEAMTKASVSASQRSQARKILQLLIDDRTLLRIQGEMFMHTKVVQELKTKLQTYAAQHEPDRLIDVPAFKDLAGVSRKYAIPLLEFFDREQVTRRAGDKRLILKPRVS
ncbi:MAG TPA: selenocysteine-specific translation elongation factor [Pyrinomonadaceae bacterium]|jgi:selenocysteine-specific elongation factor|nr:selenocysteine-specific translation elongation factor [Pyrinomonadaceae bacterium]